MSISSEISRIKSNVTSAYSALSAKGATMPSVLNTANLKSTIESIEMMTAEAMSIETIWEICGYDPSGLPKGYTLLEYIQSSGTQYINTGFKPNNNTRVVADCDLISAGQHPTAFGTWTKSGSAHFAVMALNSSTLRYFYNTGYCDSTVNIMGRHLIDTNGNTVFVDGVRACTATAGSFASSNPLLLLSFYSLEAEPSFQTTAKYYSCQIYDNGVLARDFVPCINPSGVYGLYDKVNATFYANAGSGSFTGA